MSDFVKNKAKERIIKKYGETAGLPLFNQIDDVDENNMPIIRIPDWVYSGTGNKSKIYHELKDTWHENRIKVLDALIELGGAATDNEVKERSKLEVNIVTGRRYDLVQLGLVFAYGKKKIGPHGAANTVWCVNFSKVGAYLGI